MFAKSVIVLTIGLFLFILADNITKKKENEVNDWYHNIPWDGRYRNIVLCRTFGQKMVLKQRYFRKIQNKRIQRFSKDKYYKHEEDGC